MRVEPLAKTVSFDEFCEQNGMELVAHERSKHSGLEPWYVSAKSVEIREGGFLTSRAGNGATPEEAKRDYAEGLAGHRLLVHGVEVIAPNEWRTI